MKKLFASAILLTVAVSLYAASDSEVQVEQLPAPLTNNSVVSFRSPTGLKLYSFMGMGARKTWDSVTNATYVLDGDSGKWSSGRPVPGTAGRLGAVALEARDYMFLFGGYVLDSKGGESTIADVNVYDPEKDRWYSSADIPIPVSGSIGGVYRDRYLYLVSGWSKTGAVQDVQMFDLEKSVWLQATPIPGPAVFGHAGALVDDTIVYIDGAKKNPDSPSAYVASDEAWMGKIDHKDPTKIQWSKLPPHPGTARFRIAAGGSNKDNKVYFYGGSDRPYNTFGKGFDGQPAEPSPMAFAYYVKNNKWIVINPNVTNPTMDQRAVLVTSKFLVLVGGMAHGQAVTAAVTVLPKQAK